MASGLLGVKRWGQVLLGTILVLLAVPTVVQAQIFVGDQNAVMRQYEPPPRKPPSLGGRISVPIAGVPQERFDDTRFRLQSIDLEGAVSVSPTRLAPAWASLLGREITLTELNKALDEIAAIYRRNDIFARALVPPQDFSSGRLRVVVYEGYIRDLVVTGDASKLKGQLEPLIRKITSMRPLKISEAYRALLLATDLSGVVINANLTPVDDDPGAGRMELVIGFEPGSLALTLDNYGSQDLGLLQASAEARVNGIFGLHEATEFIAAVNPSDPSSFALASLNQTIPLGLTGFAVNYGAAYLPSNQLGRARLFDVRTVIATAQVGVSYALLRAEERNVILSLGLNGNDTTVDILSAPVSRSYTRWASIGLKYNDELGGVNFLVNASLLKGIDGFWANGPAEYAAATITGVANADLTDTLSALLLFNGQYAFGHTLPASLLAYFGGRTFGRAFDLAAVAGSNAVFVSLELAQKIEAMPSWLPNFQLIAYGDLGAVWNPPGSIYPIDFNAVTNQQSLVYESAVLASAGFGFRTGIGERLTLSGLVAQPLSYNAQLAALGVDQSTHYRFVVGRKF